MSRARFYSLTFCSLLWPRAVYSGEVAGLSKKEKSDRERAGEEHESPRESAVDVSFVVFAFSRPRQPRFEHSLDSLAHIITAT